MEGKFAYVAIVLTIIWIALIYNPSITIEAFIEELIAGIIVSIGIAAITSKNFEGLGIKYFHPKRIAYFIAFFFVFLKEMVKANLHMAKIVLSPKLPVKPGIVEIETKLKLPSAKLFLGNAITLTPGTMTIDYSNDKAYIHWVYVESVEAKKAGEIIKGRFEKLLKGVSS
ncbi:MAG: Na+/H+ antiporter subunit E [Thermoplasmata archaeon]|nr:MAG: Na+/H+ antiporter subunit E [Thermoplasmata archaeon]KAA0008969.1 MAG: Na+/H+ antiporter subunit E [Thermoplasmata archaeon]